MSVDRCKPQIRNEEGGEERDKWCTKRKLRKEKRRVDKENTIWKLRKERRKRSREREREREVVNPSFT